MSFRSSFAVIALLFGLTAAAPAEPGASLRAISLGVLQYAPAGPNVESSATDINDFGQVIGESRSRVDGWAETMLWQPDTPNATASTLRDFQTIFGTHSPNLGLGPGLLGETGALASRRGVFLPDTPNGLTGRVDSAWEATLPNRGGVAAFSSSTDAFRVDAAGGRTLVYTHADSPTTNVVINNRGAIFGHAGAPRRLRDMFVWTPGTPNGTAGTVATFQMPFAFTNYPDLFLNDLGQAVASDPTGSYDDSVTSTYLYRPEGGGSVVSMDDLLGVAGLAVFDLNDRGQMLADLVNADGTSANVLLTPDGAGGFARLRIDDTPTQRIDANTLVRRLFMQHLNNHDQLVGKAEWSEDNGVTWQVRATMLVVPEPGAVGVFAVVVVEIARRRRRS